MSLLELLKVPESHVLEQNYAVLQETHLEYLRKHPNTQIHAVTGQQAEKFIGDLNGLLDSLAVNKKFHYLITRMNGYLCSNAYDGEKLEFLIPDTSIASQFMGIYTSLED